MALSPMMQQYMQIKENHKDCILFFRLGDFYEMFFEDAITSAKELELTLTGRNCGQEERAPMCGVPFHSAESYISKLIERGYKVAICEQVEDPSEAKGIVRREVVQIVTPGTLMNGNMLKEKENNYLASIFSSQQKIALTYCDISTGEMCSVDFSVERGNTRLINELVKINAREILISESVLDIIEPDDINNAVNAYINKLDNSYFDYNASEKAIFKQFNVNALIGLGLEEKEEVVSSLGALLAYLNETQKNHLDHISSLKLYDLDGYMSLDKTAIRNLEITETLFEKKAQGSLLGVLDKTNTAMGSRKMKKWLREPLIKADDINKRLDAVEILYEDLLLRNNVREHLKTVYDIERLASRIACGSANGKDLIALRNSLSVLPAIKEELSYNDSILLKNLENSLNPLPDICELISKSITEEPPFTIKEGNIIKEGYSEELDLIKNSIKDGQLWIANLEESERNRTGIKNLKVGFNKVFGYYLEITKSYYSMIPENYVRKQTLSNCERFITPELKEMESLVLNAETKINKLEYELFIEIRKQIAEAIPMIQGTADAISSLDVLSSFAEVSSKLNYIKPEINDGNDIHIEKGRHPVIEQMCLSGTFVPNDTYLNKDNSSLLLITGPNMSGKSTYMRQTALIVLMAQVGCFVPCDTAKIGVVDKIFTRIGASDNLAQGQSTFFVEMSELACILNTATEKSLVILDEIGRGTSTYDGLSIAWAATEYLCNENKQIRTLFATHYHELTVLEQKLEGVKNLNVEVSEDDGNAIFLHKIAEGSASRSYGIHVAKLAGVPKSVLQRAEERLFELEKSKKDISNVLYTEKELTFNEDKLHNLEIESKLCEAQDKKTAENIESIDEEIQLSLFMNKPSEIIQKLKSIDLMNLTPAKAIGLIEELQILAKLEE